MNPRRTAPRGQTPESEDRLLKEILGYLNFSGGKPDASFQRNWNALFERSEFFESDTALPDFLNSALARLQPTEPVLADSSQAAAVVSLVFDECLPAYRAHHADLLFHLIRRRLPPALLPRPYRRGRAGTRPPLDGS